MKIKHVSNIKYKGFHPIEKRKALQEINRAIDNYNNYDSNIDTAKSISIAQNEYEKYINKRYPGYLGVMVQFRGDLGKELPGEISRALKRLDKDLAQEILSWVQSSGHQSIKEIKDGCLEKIEAYAERERPDVIRQARQKMVASVLSRVKKYFTQKIESKKRQLVEHYIPKWIKETNKISVQRTALNNLSLILQNKSKDSLTPEELDELEKSFSSARAFPSVINFKDEIRPLPVANCDKETGRLIVSLMAMITNTDPFTFKKNLE